MDGGHWNGNPQLKMYIDQTGRVRLCKRCDLCRTTVVWSKLCWKQRLGFITILLKSNENKTYTFDLRISIIMSSSSATVVDRYLRIPFVRSTDDVIRLPVKPLRLFMPPAITLPGNDESLGLYSKSKVSAIIKQYQFIAGQDFWSIDIPVLTGAIGAW